MKKFYFSTQKISQNVAKNQASTKKRERTQNIACGVRFTYVLYLIENERKLLQKRWILLRRLALR
jgi:hypothetical protein